MQTLILQHRIKSILKILSQLYILISKIPINVAINAAIIFGLFSNLHYYNNPELSKKIAGNIIAGNIADVFPHKIKLV